MTGAQGEKPDAEVVELKATHARHGWAIVRLDDGAIRAMRAHTGNQQITSSYDAAELDVRLKRYGPRPI